MSESLYLLYLSRIRHFAIERNDINARGNINRAKR